MILMHYCDQTTPNVPLDVVFRRVGKSSFCSSADADGRLSCKFSYYCLWEHGDPHIVNLLERNTEIQFLNFENQHYNRTILAVFGANSIGSLANRNVVKTIFDHCA